MKTILIQGASTAAGWYDMEHAGWANRLCFEALSASQVSPQEAVLLQNDAIPGNTLSAIVRDTGRVDKFQRIGTVAAVLAVGLNEAKIIKGTTQPLVPLPRFQDLLDIYGEYMNSRNVMAIYVGTELLLHQTIVTENGNTFEDDLVAEYDQLLKQHATNQGMPYIPTSELLLEIGPKKTVCADGYHPNALGHAVIYSAVRDSLENIGILKTGGSPQGLYPHQA